MSPEIESTGRVGGSLFAAHPSAVPNSIHVYVPGRMSAFVLFFEQVPFCGGEPAAYCVSRTSTILSSAAVAERNVL